MIAKTNASILLQGRKQECDIMQKIVWKYQSIYLVRQILDLMDADEV
jgi:hypothetical protein